MVIISLTKMFYIIYLWKNRYLDVKNFSLNKLTSLRVRLIVCTKDVRDLRIGIGGALKLGLGIDHIFSHSIRFF